MDETSKSRKIWGDLERPVLTGKGIDIGCGPDPVTPDVRPFDLTQGDANCISQYVKETFDFVYSSHCLEHMHDPRKAILEWWKLVKPGGHLFFVVPDEDIYEMGVFPSRFNPDHKATFTISKTKSWSPVSINVLDLVRSLPDGKLISVTLQDNGYDRRQLVFGKTDLRPWQTYLVRRYRGWRRRGLPFRIPLLDGLSRRQPIDQTLQPNVLAQIQCIVQKLPDVQGGSQARRAD
jgi:SAM-dependent methyltransferase